MERWRRGMTAVAVEDHHERRVIVGDRVFQDADVTFTEEQYARMVHGYVCCRCYEPHDHPFPEECSLCGFPIRSEQARSMEHEFEGHKWIGPSREMMERLNTPLEQPRPPGRNGSRIWVPGDA